MYLLAIERYKNGVRNTVIFEEHLVFLVDVDGVAEAHDARQLVFLRANLPVVVERVHHLFGVAAAHA